MPTEEKVRNSFKILVNFYKKVAIKILEKNKITDQSDVVRITREIAILKKLKHPNLIQLYEIIETGKNIYLVMEYAPKGELFEYIVSKTKLSEKEAAKFYLDIINGVEYLHDLRIVHRLNAIYIEFSYFLFKFFRDLKPENLLLDEKNNIKIVDFGLGNLYEEGQLLQTACGSPCYAAPEMIAGKKYKGIETDVWSSGVILFAMICGYLPFEDKITSKLYAKIMKGEFIIPNFVSNEAKDLIEKLLNIDPKARINIKQIKSHCWFASLRIKIVDNEEILRKFSSAEEMNMNEFVLEKMTNLNVKKEYILKCLKENKHNNITASYFLYLKQIEGLRQTDEFTKVNCKISAISEEKKENSEKKSNRESVNKKIIIDKERFNNFINSLAKKSDSKNGYSTNMDFKVKNIPKSFDISFNQNKGYLEEINKQNQLDLNKSFRIKSSFHNKPKITIMKYISLILKHIYS